MPPKVSVVIPTYNNALLLPETLDGVRRQTCQDLEIIVVDDGSTDHTAEMIERYDPTIRYLRQSNQGPAAARNKGVSLAQGEFIAFCDHDDIWNERHLEVLLGCFAAHSSTAMAFNNAQYFGAGVATAAPHIGAKVVRSLVGKAVPIKRLWQCWVASMSVVMVKRSVFEELGGLHAAILALDDLHFYLRLGARFEVRYADYVGCKKRLRSNNLLPQAALDGLIACLEDLKQHHPDVVRAVGPFQVRTRLARRYRKLAERHLKNGRRDLAGALFLKAYKENFLNLCDLGSYLFRARAGKGLVCHGQ